MHLFSLDFATIGRAFSGRQAQGVLRGIPLAGFLDLRVVNPQGMAGLLACTSRDDMVACLL